MAQNFVHDIWLPQQALFQALFYNQWTVVKTQSWIELWNSIFSFFVLGGPPTSTSHFFHPSVCHAPYLKNSTSCDHNFWYTRVQLRYLKVLFSIFIKFWFFGLLAGFPLLGDMGGGSPLPLAQNLLIPPHTPRKIPLPPTPRQRFISPDK